MCNEGACLRATREIAPGEPLASIPPEALLNRQAVRGSAIGPFIAEDVEDEVALAAYLLFIRTTSGDMELLWLILIRHSSPKQREAEHCAREELRESEKGAQCAAHRANWLTWHCDRNSRGLCDVVASRERMLDSIFPSGDCHEPLHHAVCSFLTVGGCPGVRIVWR